jgi:hypothetical protein
LATGEIDGSDSDSRLVRSPVRHPKQFKKITS